MLQVHPRPEGRGLQFKIKSPETQPRREHSNELFESCYNLKDPKEIRARIINFFLDCGAFNPQERVLVTDFKDLNLLGIRESADLKRIIDQDRFHAVTSITQP